jgi:hypothetical protein
LQFQDKELLFDDAGPDAADVVFWHLPDVTVVLTDDCFWVEATLMLRERNVA